MKLKPEQIEELFERRTLYVSRFLATEISANTNRRTPRDTGRARRSWTPSINVPKAENIDPRESDERHDIASVTRNLKLGDTYYYSNGQPYINRLEFESWSPQAPNGILRVSVEEAHRLTAEALRHARKINL